MAGYSGSLPDAWKRAQPNKRGNARRLAAPIAALLACGWLSIAGVAHAAAAQCESWPQWQRFKQLYLSDDGRVIDASSARRITVSEGQSYALTFALVANDPDAFARILRWTQNNLARGDFNRALPAWQWGRKDDGSWGVLDENSAADADLWIAYALTQAGRLWHDEHYAALGQAVADRILREEIAFIPGLGTTVLPGPKGFVEASTWRLNASYVPIQLLRATERHAHNELWSELLQSSQRLITASAPHGAASDWLDYRLPDGFVADASTHGVGSYDAIRVYLWAGTLSSSDSLYRPLSRQFAPMLELLKQRPAPPEIIEPDTMNTRGEGGAGFYAALMPLLSRSDAADIVKRYRAQVDANALRDDQHYYNDVLSLFGIGWMDARYRFDRSGELQPQWSAPCPAH